MTLKLSTAKIIDLDTAFDATPVETAQGQVIWATVTIEYILSGLKPAVQIRVPVPWDGSEDRDSRRGQALRCARQLIEHACRAAGVGPPETEQMLESIGQAMETIVPSTLEGISQELGLAKPTTK